VSLRSEDFALDQPHHQGDVALPSQAVVSFETELDFVCVFLIHETLELGEALAWNDHAARETGRLRADQAINECEAVTIRRHHSQLPIGCENFEVHAVEVVSRLVERSGVHRTLDHLAQDRGLKSNHLPRGELRQRRILLRRGTREVEARATAAKLDVGLRARVELHALFRKLSHDVVELSRRDCDRTGLRHLRGMGASNPYLEISCRKLELSRIAFSGRREEHVREDRHRVALFDDRLDSAQAALQLDFVD